MYQLHEQYVDVAAGFHVIELRNELGHKHIVQIAIGFDACPLCGHATIRNHEGIDVKATVADVIDTLSASEAAVHAHAERHGVKLR